LIGPDPEKAIEEIAITATSESVDQIVGMPVSGTRLITATSESVDPSFTADSTQGPINFPGDYSGR
jgi:orotate phosphoribosyltransferase-like protein